MTAAATFDQPLIIQGGMGIGVSHWLLARAVSLHGQLGVVSGTALDNVLVRRLQDGDVGGHIRRAIEHFPIPDIGPDVLRRYFLPEGRPAGEPYAAVPMYRQVVSAATARLTMLANFVEVFLAKEGHDGLIGVNYLSKVQMPTLSSIYGAMLASVDYVLMGAGIPREIPGVLDRFAAQEPATIRFDVDEAGAAVTEQLHFDPRQHWHSPRPLARPKFLPIVSTDSLATMLARKANGKVDGFVIEAASAGGHNAPPRGTLQLNGRGEPVYGERDRADLARMRTLGLPFWLGGGMGSPAALRDALARGAAGVQVGTIFAFCKESGIDPVFRQKILERARRQPVGVLTDPRASPTGYPFKVVEMDGSLSQEQVYLERERVCDLGYLRSAYRRKDGRIGYRCAAEPVDAFMLKDGAAEETRQRKCLCNALMADIGLGQRRKDGRVEPPLLTSGDELRSIGLLLQDRADFTASDVITHLLAGQAERPGKKSENGRPRLARQSSLPVNLR